MNAQYCHTNSTKHFMKLEIQPLILIAEDNESNYLLLFTLLKRDYRIIHAFEQDRRTAYACGCNAYVTKPMDIHELTSIISLLLSIKEHHDSI